MSSIIKAVVFDAYGTLFDVYALSACAETLIGERGLQLITLWRDKQLEYTRLRTLCERYADFWCITEDALIFSCELLGVKLSEEGRAQLMSQYLRLSAFPEVVSALQRIRESKLPLAILSNGTQRMLDSAVTNSRMEQLFDHILSVDAVKKFKTAPQAYRLALDTLHFREQEILFVSSNCWDACCATWFGYTTFWINRYRSPIERLGIMPTIEGYSMNDVAEFLNCP
jgi:2-haloacid dehalogenase